MEEARNEKIKQNMQIKLDTIMETNKKHALREKAVADFHRRAETEEAARLNLRMSEI
jgi:hypothetical protein